MGVARGAAETQHRVFLDRLEPAPADQGGVFVGLEVRQADDHWPRVEGGGDRADALRQPLDEVVAAVGMVADQLGDAVALRRVLDAVGMDERHRVRLDGLAR